METTRSFNGAEIRQLKETLLEADNQLDEFGLSWNQRVRREINLMIKLLQDKEKSS